MIFNITQKDIYPDGSIRYIQGNIEGLPKDLTLNELEQVYETLTIKWNKIVFPMCDKNHIFTHFTPFEKIPVRICRPYKDGVAGVELDLSKRIYKHSLLKRIMKHIAYEYMGLEYKPEIVNNEKNIVDGYAGISPDTHIDSKSFRIYFQLPY